MILQLNPTIPVIVTSKDNAKGYAILVTDYSQEHHLYWTVALDNGEIWTVPNTEIRLQDNWTMGRREGVQAILCPFCLKPCGKSCRQWIDAENKAAREEPLATVGSPDELIAELNDKKPTGEFSSQYDRVWYCDEAGDDKAGPYKCIEIMMAERIKNKA